MLYKPFNSSSAYPHAPGPALYNRVPPPTESRLNCWQMTLPPLQMLPAQPFPRGAGSMTEVRRLILYAMTMEWQWNNDSRPDMLHAQGGRRGLHLGDANSL